MHILRQLAREMRDDFHTLDPWFAAWLIAFGLIVGATTGAIVAEAWNAADVVQCHGALCDD